MITTIETSQRPTSPDPLVSRPINSSADAMTRLESMGLSYSTARVVQAKLAALSQEQLLRIMHESVVIAKVKPPSSALLRTLPSYSRKTQHTKLLVLDLDDTLVHSSDSGDFEVQLKQQSLWVRTRPHAAEFLREAGRLYEVAVYTASEAVYADQVLKHLDPTGCLLQHRLYRESCLQAGPFLFKDLRVFTGFALKDIVMVDNSMFGYAFQRANGVPVSTWTGDEEDTELLALLPYLRLLAPLTDVRPFNCAVFNPLYHFH
jgi:Dullard-like phosphatase family protein